ncbi:MAG: S8 family serine peptidase [Atopobiaceae bacterium]|nr:S8 family serine peptidase [Atopobiaceae bacterium]
MLCLPILALLMVGCGSGGRLGYATATPDENGQINMVFTPAPDDFVVDEETGVHYVRGIVLVFFAPDAQPQERDELLKSVGGEIVGRFDFMDQCQVRLKAQSLKELEDICATLEESELVDRAIIDTVMEVSDAATDSDDPWKGASDKKAANPVWLNDLSIPETWQFYDQGLLDDITLGVVDCGFDMDHEDLSGVLTYASDADTPNRNERDHGTHVAGIMGATANNGLGIAGVTRPVTIVCYDASINTGDEDADDMSTSQLIAGLFQTVRAGAKVVNFSVGGSTMFTEKEWPDHESIVRSDGFVFSRAMGALLNEGHDFVVVLSAGNGDANGKGIDTRYNLCFASIDEDNCDTTYVGTDQILGRVITVASLDQVDDAEHHVSSWSNAPATLYVPGVDIYSTVVDGYDYMSGTSMAAPLASGIAGLVWSADPSLTGPELKAELDGTARDEAGVENYAPQAYPLVYRRLLASGKLDPWGESVKLYRSYLQGILDNADTYVGGFPSSSGGETSAGANYITHYAFAIGNLNEDDIPELVIFSNENPVGGAPFSVYSCNPESSSVWETGMSTLPLSKVAQVKFFRSGWIEYWIEGSQDGEGSFFPAWHGLGEAYGLTRSKDSLGFHQRNGSLHLLILGGYAADDLGAISEDEHQQILSELMANGESPVALAPFTQESIDGLV